MIINDQFYCFSVAILILIRVSLIKLWNVLTIQIGLKIFIFLIIGNLIGVESETQLI